MKQHQPAPIDVQRAKPDIGSQVLARRVIANNIRQTTIASSGRRPRRDVSVPLIVGAAMVAAAALIAIME